MVMLVRLVGLVGVLVFGGLAGVMFLRVAQEYLQYSAVDSVGVLWGLGFMLCSLGCTGLVKSGRGG